MVKSDTIAAIATAPGRGGVGVIRLSGSNLLPFAFALTGKQPQPRYATLANFMSVQGDEGEVIDTGLLLYFPAPHSFTGEDVLELQGHGGPVVLQMLLARCLDLGARLAQPGEFSQRAFLNGKLDLAQAEAIADLIEAGTNAAARSAIRSLQGDFSKLIQGLQHELTQLRMLVEATLDFPDEEIDFLQASDAFGRLTRLQTTLQQTTLKATQGKLLQSGLHVVLAGQPNVGKSSLLNRLSGDDLAIVTPIAGTTRDALKSTIQIQGIPLHIIDTAGLRETNDTVEKMGIERSWKEIAKADLVLLLLDAQHGLSAEDEAILARIPEAVPRITVWNKIDLSQPQPRIDSAGEFRVCVSAKTGQGIDTLEKVLLEKAGWQQTEDVFIARERHLRALQRANEHLDIAFLHVQSSHFALELFAEELRLCQHALGEITGEFTPDDLLGVIFSQFCIGK
ncbi:MAG: tRNA uridine-5-carboxymethylaminomethyl(34) synthesis GTPase MnmE [Pseudomonadota bacterium]